MADKTAEILKELRRCEGRQVVFNMHNKFTLQEVQDACDHFEQADAEMRNVKRGIREIVKFVENGIANLPYEKHVYGAKLCFKAAIAKAEEIING